MGHTGLVTPPQVTPPQESRHRNLPIDSFLTSECAPCKKAIDKKGAVKAL